MTNRNAELAKIHIGKKQLHMDDQTYSDMLWTHGRVRSSADLDEYGRHQVIEHMLKCGVEFTSRKTLSQRRPGAATAAQVGMINALWQNLVTARVINDDSPAAQRAWMVKNTVRHHPKKLGYTAPQFLPHNVAIHIIEQLKKWCDRARVDY